MQRVIITHVPPHDDEWRWFSPRHSEHRTDSTKDWTPNACLTVDIFECMSRMICRHRIKRHSVGTPRKEQS